jgi:hypothetical protein
VLLSGAEVTWQSLSDQTQRVSPVMVNQNQPRVPGALGVNSVRSDPGGKERLDPMLVRPIMAQQHMVANGARTGPSSKYDHHDRIESGHILSARELSRNDRTLRCLGPVSFKRRVRSSL